MIKCWEPPQLVTKDVVKDYNISSSFSFFQFSPFRTQEGGERKLIEVDFPYIEHEIEDTPFSSKDVLATKWAATAINLMVI